MTGRAEIDIPAAEPSLKTAEVARALGVSVRAVRTWADEGKIACYRTFGGHRLFLVSEVRRVLAGWGRPGLAVVVPDEPLSAEPPPCPPAPLTPLEDPQAVLAQLEENPNERGIAHG